MYWFILFNFRFVLFLKSISLFSLMLSFSYFSIYVSTVKFKRFLRVRLEDLAKAPFWIVTWLRSPLSERPSWRSGNFVLWANEDRQVTGSVRSNNRHLISKLFIEISRRWKICITFRMNLNFVPWWCSCVTES